MNFNPSELINTGVSVVTGAFIATTSFRLFMPPNPQRARRYVVSRMREGLKKISEMNPIPSYSDWQTRNYDRVYRLSNPENPSAVKTFEWYEGGVAIVNLGNEVLRLRHLLADGALPESVAKLARSVLRSFHVISTDPNSTRLAIEAAAAELEKLPLPVDGSRLACMRLRYALEEMRAVFSLWPRFLTTR
jgi:uncharacterized membrane protein YccC